MKEQKEKFRISIIDFMPEHGKHKVGEDKNGEDVHLGNLIEYNGDKSWFVVYRYGNVLLKQVGMIAMIGLNGFSTVSKVKNTFGAGNDWLIIGYTDDPLYEKLKHITDG